ncbi:MAG: hypothetical protein V2B20_10085 [Pseudomonadota bacterium]
MKYCMCFLVLLFFMAGCVDKTSKESLGSAKSTQSKTTTASGEPTPQRDARLVNVNAKDTPNIPSQSDQTIAIGSNKIALCLAISPDGKYVATGHNDATVSFWDLSTGKEIAHFMVPQSKRSDIFKGAEKMIFSPDSKLLAIAEEKGYVVIVDIQSGKVLYTLEDVHINCKDLAFSPDGRTLAIAVDGNNRYLEPAIFWDMATGKKIPTDPYDELTDKYMYDYNQSKKIQRTVHELEGMAVAYSPDGQFIAIVCHKAIVVADAATRRKIRLFVTPGVYVNTGVAFSPDGKLIAVTNGSEATPIRIFDPATGKLVKTLYGLDGNGSVVFTSDGRFLVASDYDKIQFWNTKTWKMMHNIDKKNASSSHYSGGQEIALSPQNDFVLALDNKNSNLWIRNIQEYSEANQLELRRAEEVGLAIEELRAKKGKIEDLRKSDTFDGYAQAFMVLRAKEDFVALQKKATTQEQKKKMEYFALLAVGDLSKVFRIDVKFSIPESAIKDNRANGKILILKVETLNSRFDFSGTSTVRLDEKSPIKPLKNTYRVYVRHTLELLEAEKSEVTFIVHDIKEKNNVIKIEKELVYEIGSGARNVSTQKIDFGNRQIARKTQLMNGVGNSEMKLKNDPKITSEIIRIEQI